MSFNRREINHRYLLLHDICEARADAASNYIGSLALPVSPLPLTLLTASHLTNSVVDER